MQQPMLTHDELRELRRDLSDRVGLTYTDGGSTRRALLAVEELIALRERILKAALTGEPLVAAVEAPVPPSAVQLLTESVEALS